MSSNTGGGGGPQPTDLFTQQMAQRSAGGRVESAKNFDELISQILEGPVRWISKATGINLTTAMNTGIFAHFKMEEAGIKVGEAINKGATTLGAQGGVIARELSIVANKENMWQGVTDATIEGMPVEAQQQIASIRDMMGEGMPVTAMSDGSLGNLSPSAGGGMVSGPDMGMMA